MLFFFWHGNPVSILLQLQVQCHKEMSKQRAIRSNARVANSYEHEFTAHRCARATPARTAVRLVLPHDPESDEQIISLYEQAIRPNTRVLLVTHLLHRSGPIIRFLSWTGASERFSGLQATPVHRPNVSRLQSTANGHQRKTMNIREAATEDLEHIVQLFGQLGYSTKSEQVENHFHELRQSASGQAFVAEDCGNIVGVAIVHTIKPLHAQASWALLSALVVDDKCRSSGVGASLLAAAEGFAMHHGCSQLELSSSSARTRAHMFYERNGYQEKRLRFVKILS